MEKKKEKKKRRDKGRFIVFQIPEKINTLTMRPLMTIAKNV
jgi:Fe-S cluster assembly ATPase SufC